MSDRADELVAGLEADLAALAAAEADLERDAEAAERTRTERTSITIADRLRATQDPVEVSTRGGARHAGRVVEVGDGWLLLAHAPTGSFTATAEHLVVLDSVVTVRGLGRLAEPAAPMRARSLTSVLRAWCRDRSEVSVLLADGAVVTGRAAATFRDHLELTVGPDAAVAVPLPALAVVSR